MHILVIDDYEDGATMLAEALRQSPGVNSVEVGFDGVDGVSFACRRRPDVVVLDLEMPRLGGVDAAAAIRLFYREAKPRMVAMSGNPDSVDAASLTGVFDHVLLKPFAVSTLLALVTVERTVSS